MRGINGLDLFSGIGGLTMALRPWLQPLAYCENDRYAQGVLLCRMRSGDIPAAPIWDDVLTLEGRFLPSVDIIYGGFPCQDISVAGHGKGLDGERSGLFKEVARLAEEINPSFLFLENVPAIRTRGAERVVKRLARAGYDCRWDVVSAAEVGALHERKRWFLLAHANNKKPNLDNYTAQISNPNCETLRIEQRRRLGESREFSQVDSQDGERWFTSWASKGGFKPRVSRTGNGVPFNVDRDRTLGNAVVPLQAKIAFKRLMGMK